jgi:hypothetical protein
MNRYLFLLGDADNVRKRIQGLLLSGDLDALRSLSSSLTRHITELGALAEDTLGADIVFCGGDELLAKVELDNFDERKLREIMAIFSKNTGVTISFGVGLNTEEVFVNLARAKSMGPGSVFLSVKGAAANQADREDD